MDETIGKVTIAPEVLTTIVRQTALSQPGVVRLSGRTPNGMSRLWGRVAVSEGLRIAIGEGTIAIDLYLVAKADENLLRLGQALQSEITRAINHMVGLEVSAVNVHIEDVVFTGSPP